MSITQNRPMTVREAATALGLSVHTIRSWIAQRRLAHVRLGRSIRILPAAVKALLSSCTVEAVHLVNCDDGAKPNAVTIGIDTNFYGTTYSGGNNFAGTVFKMTAAGKFKVLYKFSSNTASNPYAGLVQGTDGNFYGTTFVGGPARAGTIFDITPTGALTILQDFTNADGALPQAALIQGADSSFYGTTGAGGPNNDGVVFKLSKN